MNEQASSHPEGRAPLSERIAPHLPLLRRHARTLAGSQSGGDAHVVALLEALIADPSAFPAIDDARVGLFSAFHRLWASTNPDPVSPDLARNTPEQVAHERLSRLTPRARQALLLTAVEGFGAADAATILDVSVDELHTLVANAIDDLRAQTAARILIIEDEPIIAMDIEAIVSDLGHSVVAIADTRDRAVAAARAHLPDIVLADIQLADGSSGIDAVRDILSGMTAPVIFITAYPDRLLTGLRPEPTFLISKPFHTETLQATISQALFFRVEAGGGGAPGGGGGFPVAAPRIGHRPFAQSSIRRSASSRAMP
jgi:CheY-like chemotaxis protein/DNA-directed RNA polymerase specialized sigma24 family protein